MDLRLASLTLDDFRNYRHFELPDIGDLTIFVGHNAVGKTNILEGIQLLTAATSFRHPTIGQMVRAGCTVAHLEAVETDGNRLINLSLGMEAGKRRYLINGKAHAAGDVKGRLPAVAFTPDDLQLAKRSSGVKRDALDELGSQLTGSYDVVKRDYEKVVRYKNRLLKGDAPDALVQSINETLVTCGSQLFCYRTALFRRLLERLGDYYATLSLGHEKLSARYEASWDASRETSMKNCISSGAMYSGITRDDVRELLSHALDEALPAERRRGRSVIGPHADQITLLLDGADVADFASQGQQRSVVLAWKLAEVGVVEESLHQHPVLLLDDVMSELDAGRRDALVSFVQNDIQTFITATNLEFFNRDLIDKARVVRLPIEGTV